MLVPLGRGGCCHTERVLNHCDLLHVGQLRFDCDDRQSAMRSPLPVWVPPTTTELPSQWTVRWWTPTGWHSSGMFERTEASLGWPSGASSCPDRAAAVKWTLFYSSFKRGTVSPASGDASQETFERRHVTAELQEAARTNSSTAHYQQAPQPLCEGFCHPWTAGFQTCPTTIRGADTGELCRVSKRRREALPRGRYASWLHFIGGAQHPAIALNRLGGFSNISLWSLRPKKKGRVLEFKNRFLFEDLVLKPTKMSMSRKRSLATFAAVID